MITFVVSHGKSGAVGCFSAQTPMHLDRGDRVVVESVRGLEVGEVLGEANQAQMRLLGPQLAGYLLRPLSPADATQWQQLQDQGQQLIDAANGCGYSLTILDADVLLDGQCVLQYLAAQEEDWAPLIERLAKVYAGPIRLENLAIPKEKEPEHAGCGKPDCGQSEGGCSTCSTGGCGSSCGTGPVDLKPYFSHLREKMDQRIPLV